jgi:hypothetical protein
MKYAKSIIFLVLNCNLVLFSAAQDFDDIDQATGATIEALSTSLGEMEGFEEGVGPAFQAFGNVMGGIRSGLEFYNSMQTLDNNECVPDFTTPAEAMMPTGCDNNSSCSNCYQESISRLNTVRKSLSRMTCIYNNTKRFTDASISFGDNVSGIHGMMGLAWQNERRGIEQSLIKFEKTYDNKYKDLMESLQKALNGISRCEAEFGMENWYQRFGFMYFEMMKEKYKRTN